MSLDGQLISLCCFAATQLCVNVTHLIPNLVPKGLKISLHISIQIHVRYFLLPFFSTDAHKMRTFCEALPLKPSTFRKITLTSSVQARDQLIHVFVSVLKTQHCGVAKFVCFQCGLLTKQSFSEISLIWQPSQAAESLVTPCFCRCFSEMKPESLKWLVITI